MGEDFAAFGAAGHRVSNSDAAQLLDDPTLTTSDLDEAGRLSGYEITYYSFKSGAVLDQHFGLVNGVVGVELFESEAEASKYVLVLLDGYEHQEGRTFDQGVTVMFVQPFDVTKVSETARGLEMLAVQGSRSVYTTIVIFQTGRLVATAALSLANGAPVRNRVLEIAERLQARIDHVAAGGVTTQIVENPSSVCLAGAQAEVARDRPHCGDDVPDVLVEFNPELLGAAVDLVPVHTGGERGLLELLPDRFRLQRLDPVRPDEAARVNETRELVAGEQRLLELRVAGHLEVLRVGEDGLDQLLRIALLTQDGSAVLRVFVERGMDLVIEVVQESGGPPELLVPAEHLGVPADRRLYCEGVTAKRLALRVARERLPRLLASHIHRAD
jgi:hypothetical protein